MIKIMKVYIGCMELTHEYGLRHFLFKKNVGYCSEVMEPWLYHDEDS
jgi:hypothetical protein